MKVYIETDRLILREILPEDVDDLFLLEADPDVHRYVGNNPVKSKAEIRKYIDSVRQQYVDNGIGHWAAVEKSSNYFIGWAGLTLIKETINNHIHYYSLGYRFIRKYWGVGYATEAAKAALTYGFDTLGLKAIYAIANCENINSNKVLSKVGLTFTETFDFDGIRHNWYQIHKAD
ncbi:GNAT family N-acetyltransferase [Olivibacter sp. SDN3]|uniref:GNAT family N-acetyltransferase n=1 Tax=Olivibacter sp. SDN3 TaxID=2764720 RepID=UPI0016513847|nr:GNAT family N-acetyltransferase [Olivibacter sp. SDN3]QNL51089.1 GNAT family N-acetyltransferase [Olivibacter sp. SDN3]